MKNSNLIKLFVIALFLFIPLTACNSTQASNSSSNSQNTIDGQPITIQTDNNNPSSNETPTPTENIPVAQPTEDLTKPAFEFEASYNQEVNAGEPFGVSFFVRNNRKLPFIACRLEFSAFDIVKTIKPEPTWEFNQAGLFKYPSLSTNNIIVSGGASLNDKFSLMIDTPGSYQIGIIPYVKAGEWVEVGSYIMTLMVKDNPIAKQKRDTNVTLQSNNEKIDSLNRDIDSAESDIRNLNGDIGYLKDDIKLIEGEIQDSEKNKADNPQFTDNANVEIETHNADIKYKKSEITDKQNQINLLNKQLRENTKLRNNIQKQNENLNSN